MITPTHEFWSGLAIYGMLLGATCLIILVVYGIYKLVRIK